MPDRFALERELTNLALQRGLTVEEMSSLQCGKHLSEACFNVKIGWGGKDLDSLTDPDNRIVSFAHEDATEQEVRDKIEELSRNRPELDG